MGLFSFVSHAWHDATSVASDAWNGATHFVGNVASDAWGGLEDAGGAIGHFFATRWKTILAVTVGTIAFAAIVAFAPEALPLLTPALTSWVVVGAAGAASGALSRVTYDLLNGKSPGWDVAKSAAISGVFSLATAGTLAFVAPKVGELLPVLQPLTSRIGNVGATAGEDTSEAENAVSNVVRPASLPRILVRAVPKGQLIVGLVAGDVGGKAPDTIKNLPQDYQQEKAKLQQQIEKMKQEEKQEDTPTTVPSNTPGFVNALGRAN
jgi:hypothetical protein